ncbi:28S ribosomal protein S30, mitochondrial [Chrysoperla carnea]|uniref:28S ribosomal protein S30, mitochondrial n=1 Tax=Chrysoperla carnea TaxID=189513 RepID=UPI001D0824B5|nr:28S ribosomal protein S30, mitochondrial [Chrysoperla carnea]
MSIVKYKSKIRLILNETYRGYSTLVATEPSKLTKLPEYPPIYEVSERARRERKFEDWTEQIKNLHTVEEKLMKINMPKYYGWESVVLNDTKIPYNALSFIQHCTRTHIIHGAELPNFYKKIESNLDAVIKDIKSEIENALIVEFQLVRRKPESKPLSPAEKENLISRSIIDQINRIIINNLSKNYEHLLTSQIDVTPRHEAFWFVGGFKPSERLRKTRKNDKFQEFMSNDPIDRPIQFIGSPFLALRNTLPLDPIISLDDATNSDFKVPFFDYNPKVLGYNNEFRHGTNIPGFWPDDPYKFGLLSFNGRGHILERLPTFGEEDNLEALHAQSILSSFAWLHSQACYQGFSTFTDLTYPLVNQNIITNGQYWSFYVYQLNTTLLHGKNMPNNPRRNICWALKPQKLFENIDENKKIIGFNDEVLKNLLKFYINQPAQRIENMTPYLGENIKTIADIEDNEKREWLEKQFKYMMSNRPRHRLQYEIYDWERIYKIDHKTRQLEPRRRPFELKDNNPIAYRRYDDFHPRYVPKKLRPEGTKRKNQNKWEKTYFP